MKLIKPSYEILTPIDWREWGIKKFIELVGRTCYKSEDKITDDSYKGFVQRMIDSKHYAMLEHGTVYITASSYVYLNCLKGDYYKNKYSIVKEHFDDKGNLIRYITTNYRVLIENGWLNDLRYLSKPTEHHAKRITVKFISSIHFYKDCTRHRTMSFAIESTRFCNYLKNKFNASISFTEPIWLKPEDKDEFADDCKIIESLYFKYLNKGYNPQHAAYFLCQGVKGDAVITASIDAWNHFFDLRALSKTGEPHPQVKELALPLYNEFVKLGYIKI